MTEDVMSTAINAIKDFAAQLYMGYHDTWVYYT